MKIQRVTDASFAPYGKVLAGYDFGGLMEKMAGTPLPADEVIYVPSVAELEALPIMADFQRRAYGGLPIQVGYCNGNNHKLNAVEYHRSSELDIAQKDLILLLGKEQDVAADGSYETAKMEAFLLPAGVGVELYATTLHYAPCNVCDDGFRCVVVLPAGTNTELDFPVGAEGEDRLITAKNKWLIAHEEAGIEGAVVGLIGENLTV